MADSLNSISLPESRTDLEVLIEAAIARLDAMDPDPDLEDDGTDEPWLGAFEQRALNTGTHWNCLVVEDREVDDDFELESDNEDGGDDENEHDGRSNYLGPCSPVIGRRA